ncbi:hypothetical protein C8Q74DRAFT_1391828 [Fomes fomentarius]|nr:hypothetical protein C8Q74DRAFT_1391828 [Fomes fomentarius]
MSHRTARVVASIPDVYIAGDYVGIAQVLTHRQMLRSSEGGSDKNPRRSCVRSFWRHVVVQLQTDRRTDGQKDRRTEGQKDRRTEEGQTESDRQRQTDADGYCHVHSILWDPALSEVLVCPLRRTHSRKMRTTGVAHERWAPRFRRPARSSPVADHNGHATLSRTNPSNSAFHSALDDDRNYMTIDYPSNGPVENVVVARSPLGQGSAPPRHLLEVGALPPSQSGPNLPLVSLYVVSGLPKSAHTWTLADTDSVLGLHHSEALKLSFTQPASTVHNSLTTNLKTLTTKTNTSQYAYPYADDLLPVMPSAYLGPSSTFLSSNGHATYVRGTADLGSGMNCSNSGQVTYHGVYLAVWSHADAERTAHGCNPSRIAQSHVASSMRRGHGADSTADPTLQARMCAILHARGPWGAGTNAETDLDPETGGEGGAVSESDYKVTSTPGHPWREHAVLAW